ncbi:MAG: DUF5674 family protein [Candidatus Colwellbacteria bacterium]|nr:DUF5674 family protein [Candidatus Colwellbacteria bacterium]
MEIVRKPIERARLVKVAEDGFGDLVKAVVDIQQEIMAIGGEMHADEEVLLNEQAGSKREDVWGINIYPKKELDEWIEFDSMINLKPAHGNRSRGVEDKDVRAKIARIVGNLIID